MLLFYTYLEASAETTMLYTPQAYNTAMSNYQDFVVFTDQEGKAILALPSNVCEIFNLISSMIPKDIEAEESFSKELIEQLNLPQDSKGWFVSIVGEGIPNFELILPYFKNLKPLFESLAEAQRENNKKKFFKKLKEFLNESREEDISWDFEQRIQFFTLFQFFSLRFEEAGKVSYFDKTAEQLFVFKLSELQVGELLLLQESRLDGIRFMIQNISELQNWMREVNGERLVVDLKHFNQPVLKVEQELDDKNLLALDNFLAKNTEEKDPETGQKIQRVTVDIKVSELSILPQMIKDQKIISLDSPEMGILVAHHLWKVLTDEERKGKGNLKTLTLNISDKIGKRVIGGINYKSLTLINELLERSSLDTLMLGIKGSFESDVDAQCVNLINTMLNFQKIKALELYSSNMFSGRVAFSEEIINLIQMLNVNTTLTSLKIKNYYTDKKIVQVLADTLKIHPALTSLSLEGDKIGDAGAKILANALTQNTTLRSLDLSHKPIDLNTSTIGDIGDAGAIALADALGMNTTLTWLDLSKNQIEGPGGKALKVAEDKAKMFRRNLTINY